MSCNDLYEGVRRDRVSTRMTTIEHLLENGTCPHSHPYRIPGSECCAEGRDLYHPKERQRAKKHVIPFTEGRGEHKRGRDDDSHFGKPRKFKQFRAAYKRKHPKASEHRILVKYTSALLRLRESN